MIILELTLKRHMIPETDPVRLTVGQKPVRSDGTEIEEAPVVEKIEFFNKYRKLYNMGSETTESEFVVYFADTKSRRVIYEDVVATKELVSIKKSDTVELNLPEG